MKSIYHYVLTKKFTSQKTFFELLIYDNINCWWFIDREIYRNTVTKIPNPLIISIYKQLYQLLVPPYELFSSLFWRILNIVSGNLMPSSTQDNNINIIFRQQLEEWKRGTENTIDSYYNWYHRTTINEISGVDSIISPYEPSYILNLTDIKRYLTILIKGDHDIVTPRINQEYWSWNVWHSKKVATEHFFKIWKEIQGEVEWIDGFAQILKMNSESVKTLLKYSLLITIPHAIAKCCLANNIIQRHHPSAMVMTNGQMTEGRVWVYECAKNNLVSLEIQHGALSKRFAYLNHDPLDVSVSKNNIGSSFPIPDLTCVWGENESDLLIKDAGYPEGSVVITGNPRYDYIHNASERYSREDFCNKHHICPNSFIILWTTQSHGWTDEENHAYFTEIFETFKDKNDITLIIKQHPGEPQKYRRFIDTYLKMYQMRCAVIVPDKMSDTTEQVFCSDLVINKNSTTGQEAIAFRKPMIILDFSDTPDIGEYVQEGVAFPVYTPGDLMQTVETIINNEIDLREKQNLYVRNHMYKLDGNSACRVASVISESIVSR